MDTRIGYPSEHLAGDTQKSETSPVLATVVGLLMNALEQQEDDSESVPSDESKVAEDSIEESTLDVVEPVPMSSSRKSILIAG